MRGPGRPTLESQRTVAEALRSLAEPAIQALYDVLLDPTVAAAVRSQAACKVLDLILARELPVDPKQGEGGGQVVKLVDRNAAAAELARREAAKKASGQ